MHRSSAVHLADVHHVSFMFYCSRSLLGLGYRVNHSQSDTDDGKAELREGKFG